MKIQDILTEANDSFAIRKAGSKNNPHYVLINRRTYSTIDMTFDTHTAAEQYAKKRGLSLDDSSMDD